MSEVPANATGPGVAGSGGDTSVSRPLSPLARRIIAKARKRFKEIKNKAKINAPRKKPK